MVGARLAGLFTESRSTVWMLLAHCLPVREILRSVDDHNKSADQWAIDGHVGVDAGCMLAGAHHGRGGHCVDLVRRPTCSNHCEMLCQSSTRTQTMRQSTIEVMQCNGQRDRF